VITEYQLAFALYLSTPASRSINEKMMTISSIVAFSVHNDLAHEKGNLFGTAVAFD